MTTIPVNDNTPYAQYEATAGQTDFPYDWFIFEDTDLLVYKNDAIVTNPTNFTVTGAGTEAGGDVVFNVGLLEGDIVTVFGNLAIERVTDLQQAGKFDPDDYNLEQDRNIVIMKELRRDIDRKIGLDPTSTGDVAGLETAVIAVFAELANVVIVAGIAANVTTVAGIAANVTIVAGIAADITTVAGVSANVTTVATNIASVNSAAANMAAIIAAPAAAATATAQAAIATGATDKWNYSSTITMADPSASNFRLNNATIASATAMAISATDVSTANLRTFIASWDDSTNTIRGTITLRKVGTPATFAIFNVTGALTDNTTWLQLALTYVTGAGSFTNADQFTIEFDRAGNVGATGGAGTNGASVYAAAAGGTADVITATLSPVPANLAALTRTSIFVSSATTNATATPTMNFNAFGAQTIQKYAPSGAKCNLAIGDIPFMAEYSHDGTNPILLNPATFSKGATIASAGTVNLNTATGNYIQISGTTTITAITLGEGRQAKVKFDGILTLTNGASLILPTGANIVTAAGDSAEFVGEASGVVRCISYQRASGAALVASGSVKTVVTASASANITFTSLDFANNTYEFYFNDLVNATDNTNFQLLVSENNFSSSAQTVNFAYGMDSAVAANIAGEESLLKFMESARTLPYQKLHGAMFLAQPVSGGSIGGTYGLAAQGQTNPSWMNGIVGNPVSLPATYYNAVRFVMSAGNLTSGTITMIRKPIT